MYSVHVHSSTGAEKYREITGKVLCMMPPRITRAVQAVRNDMKKYSKKRCISCLTPCSNCSTHDRSTTGRPTVRSTMYFAALIQTSPTRCPPAVFLRRRHGHVCDDRSWSLLLRVCPPPELVGAGRRDYRSRGRAGRLRVLQRIR